MVENLERLLQQGQDNPLLRFTLGNEYLKDGESDAAIRHLAAALDQDPGYSAAWKVYGRALADTGRRNQAVAAFEQGIRVAEAKGDIQAAKEMRVFLKRARTGA
jgi:predicted Zn-dependent protease